MENKKLWEAGKWFIGVVLAYLVTTLLDLIPFGKIFEQTKWEWVIENRFNIIEMIIFTISLIIIIGVFRLKKSRENAIEKKLKANNNFENPELGLKVTWDMYMGTIYDRDPHPCNIKIYCTKHPIPLLMKSGCCMDSDCQNANAHFDEKRIKQLIQSYLLNEQDKLMMK
ncbi:MAG: hypothetical protein OSJ35_07465 [Alistipes sp.]|nr:hypothetical protein [Alistipes sp.]